MKRYYFIACVLIICLTMFSCKKYLDVKQNTRQSLIVTVTTAVQVLNNSSLNLNSLIDNEQSADNYYLTDATWNGLTSEMRDVYVWAPQAQRLLASNPADHQWKNVYSTVSSLNVVLEALERIDRNSDPDQYDLAKGIALFIRAERFYKLAAQYAKAYDASTASQDLGIPIRLSSDISEQSTRANVQETYNRIIDDLKTAIALLPNTSPAPTRPNKAAAYGLLARVYLAMRNYTEAGAAANSSLQIKNDLFNFNGASDGDYPFPYFNKEVLFFSTMIPNYPQSEVSVDNARVDPVLYASYPANDLRKKYYFTDNGDNTYRFKAGYTNDIYNYFDGVAVDEVYLVRAECYARAGNTNAAMADLNTLLKTRWSGAYTDMTASSAQDALDKILAERRKELINRGTRWMDIKRLNKESRYAITLSRTVGGTTYQLPPNDPRYALLIPQEATEFNSKIVQNPR